jgi:tRNA(fMet)-specific endonuclease VapC
VSSSALLADTNILSYAHNEHTLWNAYQPILNGHAVLIAAQSVAELRFGALRVRWGERRTARLEALIKACPVVYPNDAICTRWARVRANAEWIGRQLGASDAWIAATALELGIPLVTHNKKDFEFVDDLTVISEREA